jgi:hypothetical protein
MKLGGGGRRHNPTPALVARVAPAGEGEGRLVVAVPVVMVVVVEPEAAAADGQHYKTLFSSSLWLRDKKLLCSFLPSFFSLAYSLRTTREQLIL